MLCFPIKKGGRKKMAINDYYKNFPNCPVCNKRLKITKLEGKFVCRNCNRYYKKDKNGDIKND